jgi:hypothetical protein
MKYTHKGWFGFCPILLANPFSNNPDVTSRTEWLMPFLRFNIWLQGLAIGICKMMDPDWEPTWKIRVSGKL